MNNIAANHDCSSNKTSLPQFQIWSRYHGLLTCDMACDYLPTSLFGFQNDANTDPLHFEVPHLGTAFGFVSSGSAILKTDLGEFRLSARQWFSLPSKILGELNPGSNVSLMVSHGFKGLTAMGGPVEERGRLRYIDGCSDTLLMPPPIVGEPCFNLLHFPEFVRQTPHTHPSTRMGMVIKGHGWCELDDRRVPLNVGDIFYIPENVVHNFSTEDGVLSVVAYHPDSDWGPRHEDHPMINRTWVNGKKIQLMN